MQRFTFPIACLVALSAGTSVSSLSSIAAESPLVMSLVDLPDVNTHTQFVTPARDERTIDLLAEDVDKQLAADQEAKFKSPIKRKHADQRTKHPFIITKDDLDNQESVVEDNIIVESGILHLNRQTKRVNNELLRARRVRRGWNLQNVIVPDEPLYQRVPQASRRWVSRPVGRSKLYWADQAPSKNNQLYNYRSWGNGVQDIHAWPAKIHG